MRGVEPSVDVAVLELGAPAGDVAPLVFADSSELRVGDPVIAIGSPFGLQGSLSTGIVSGLRRQIDSPNGFAITGVIQTDAALNPGNSGGPILDTSGRVVGVATQIASEGGRNEGIGFAVPSSVVRRTAERIIATGRASLPYLGIMGGDVGDGIALQDVLPGGPAVGAPAAGRRDHGRRRRSRRRATPPSRPRSPTGGPGSRCTIGVLRDGDAVEVPVTLAERPPAGP